MKVDSIHCDVHGVPKVIPRSTTKAGIFQRPPTPLHVQRGVDEFEN
jgi:hypothetical protein